MKKLLTGLLVVLLALGLVGCGDDLKTYKKENIEIKLPDGLTEEDSDGYDFMAYNDDILVMVFHENIDELVSYDVGFDEDTTDEQYLQIIAYFSGIENEVQKNSKGYYYVEYTSDVDGYVYYYYTMVKKTSTDFYVVTCSCLEEDSSSFSSEFETWASSLKIK